MKLLVGNDTTQRTPSLLVEVPASPGMRSVETTKKPGMQRLTEPMNSPGEPVEEEGPKKLEEG